MLTPSEILEHIYCPRFSWFMHVQNIPQHEEKRFKVLKGREIHRRRTTENRNYLRQKIGAIGREINVYLASPKLHLRGIVDEVIWLKNNTMAPLDYKYTEAQNKTFKTHETQIILYGMLIEEVYQKPVESGYIAYIRNGSQLQEVKITKNKKENLISLIQEIFQIIETGKIPKGTKSRLRCEDCCYKNICV